MKKIVASWFHWMRRPALSIVFSAAACLLMPLCYVCMCEFVRMASVYYTIGYIQPHFHQLVFSAAAFALFFAAVTFATARAWIANLIVGATLCIASWVNLQKLIYRGEPLIPKDLVQVSAALSISGEMEFSITRETWLFIILVIVTTALLFPARIPYAHTRRSLAARAGLTLAFAAALPVYLKSVVYNRELMSEHGVYMMPMSMAECYYRGTFATSFLALTGNWFLDPPDGYSKEAVAQAEELFQDQQGADEQRQCDVFVVLLESFFELSNYEGATFSEPLLENYERIAAEGVSGQMLTEKYGGGTSNIEFSVLTGFSNMLLPTGSVPYMEYVNDSILCYPSYLKEQGYTLLALHPYQRQFYNRPQAYESMGFDEFVSEEAFSESDIVGNYVGEQATLDKALELYHEAAQDGPVFMHIVTMQNHVPNQPGEYDEDYAVEAYLEGATDYYNGALSSIATSLRDIDRAIGNFVDALRDEPRDVVVLFFGDHQTPVNGTSYPDLLYLQESFTSLSAEEQSLRSHVTPYLMWANFDVKEQGVDAGLLPAYLLLPTMLNEYNVVRPAWMDWLYQSDDVMHGTYYDLYFTDETQWEGLLTEEQIETYTAQDMLQYDLLLGKQYGAATLYGAD